MQIKKEEVKLAIIEASTEEFRIYGFEQASLRRIVKKAGTTLGNFYNYFDSKEGVFSEIVSETHAFIIHMAQHHNESDEVNALWDQKDVSLWRNALLVAVRPYVPMVTDSFMILMEGSKGTAFEGTREKLASVLADHYVEHIENFRPDYSCREMGIVLANQLIGAVVDIVNRFDDQETREKLFVEQLLFFVVGTMGLLDLG